MLQNWIAFLLMTCLILGASNAWTIRESSGSYSGDNYEADSAFADQNALIEVEDPLESTHSVGGGERRKMCGNKLFHALILVCGSRRKRSATDLLSGFTRPMYSSIIDYDSLDVASSIEDPLEALNKRKMFRGLQKRREGVSDHCCKRSCTIDELRVFCPRTPKN